MSHGASRPPPSLWSAPQSLKPLPPAAHIPHPRADVYRRRVTRPDLGPDGPPPALWQRFSQLLGGGLSLAAAAWFVFWADFGPKEHCFSPIRRFTGVPTGNESSDVRMGGNQEEASNSGLALLSRKSKNWKGLLRHPENFDAEAVQRSVASRADKSSKRSVDGGFSSSHNSSRTTGDQPAVSASTISSSAVSSGLLDRRVADDVAQGMIRSHGQGLLRSQDAAITASRGKWRRQNVV